jgi:maltose O-acetyltransferase
MWGRRAGKPDAGAPAKVISGLASGRADGNGDDPVDALRRAGVTVGRGCNIYGLNYDRDLPGLVSIGDDCILAGDVTILAHDVAPAIWFRKSKLARTRVLDRCFIGQRAILLAGVTVGPDAIVGAGAVVSQDVAPRTVVAGNPAKLVCTLDEYLERQRKDGRFTWIDYDLPGQDDPRRAQALKEGRAKLRRMLDEGAFG